MTAPGPEIKFHSTANASMPHMPARALPRTSFDAQSSRQSHGSSGCSRARSRWRAIAPRPHARAATRPAPTPPNVRAKIARNPAPNQSPAVALRTAPTAVAMPTPQNGSANNASSRMPQAASPSVGTGGATNLPVETASCRSSPPDGASTRVLAGCAATKSNGGAVRGVTRMTRLWLQSRRRRIVAKMRTLYVGNKNYSSWSLRAWLLLRQLGVDFEEKKIELFADGFDRQVARVSPAGLVPVLVDDGFAVWDTLAIAEWVAERCPDKRVWPADAKARARARSICAEMHAGFSELRHRLPMNLEARLPGVERSPAVQRDIDRITSMWSGLRAEHAADGSFLFGAFGAADAFYAPVVTRFLTYAVDVPRACAEYMQTVLALPAMREWTEAALGEKRFIPEEEPYRTSRDA